MFIKQNRNADKIRKMKGFRGKDIHGDWHRVDDTGNHFVNGKCINPKTQDLHLCDDGVYRDAEIGDTYEKIVMPDGSNPLNS